MIENILVCMKAVPVSVAVPINDRFHLDRDSIGLEWNPADLSALEAALRLKGCSGKVTVITMGPAKILPLLQDLFSRGVDRTILLTDRSMGGSDTITTARILGAAVKKIGPFDLILCGRRAIDGETGQVASSLAAFLDLPVVSNVDKIENNKKPLILWRRLENGSEKIECETNIVVSVCEYSYPLRLPSILSLRNAKGNAVEQFSAKDLNLSEEECGIKGSLTKVVAMEQNFPGMRNGPIESDLKTGIQTISSMIKEVTV